MAEHDEPQSRFTYKWYTPGPPRGGYSDLVGSLDCSVGTINIPAAGTSSDRSAGAASEDLEIYSSSYRAFKGLVQNGRTYICPSYSGYLESVTGSRPEIRLSFRPPNCLDSYSGVWENFNDELLVHLYVDGSLASNEEIFIRREAPENPVKLGHLLDRYDREVQLLWEKLNGASSNKTRHFVRGDGRKLSIDQLSSFRVVISRCTLISVKGSERLEKVWTDPGAEAKARKEAEAHAGSRLSHTCTLTDAGNVRGQAIAARPKTVPEAREVVPLVEFIFYYKSKELLEKLGIKNPSFTGVTGPQIPAAVDNVNLPKRGRPTEVQSNLRRDNLSNQIGERRPSERLVGQGTRNQPIKLEDDPSPKLADEASESLSDNLTTLPNKRMRISQEDPTAEVAPLPVKGEQIVPEAGPSSRPYPPQPVEILTIPNDESTAAQVLSYLFKSTPIPEGALTNLQDLGFTSTLSQFHIEQNELDSDFRTFFALEAFDKLRKSG